MIITDKFYEDEVREGFYVPASVKQAWGATLMVLGEIDRICKKYNITYFAEWGTFLGALRHRGFIPWDDDLDIGMKRQDYEKFLEVAPSEFPEDYQIYNFRTRYEHTGFLANVVAKARICFEKEHLEKYHGYPFITGVDIFILDNVCKESVREKDRVNKCKYIIKAADDIYEGKITGHGKEEVFNFISTNCGINVKRCTDKEEQRAQMYMAAEKLFMIFNDDESDYMTRMMPNGLGDNNTFLLSKKLLNEYVELPFENIKIPVPAAYDHMMRKRYGDYMRLVKNAGGHGYPYFENQKLALEKTMGFEMPGFKPDLSLIGRKEHIDSSDSYKSVVCAYIDMLDAEIQKGYSSLNSESITKYQEMAIELGTYIESIKGEGYDIVHDLEIFCDIVFELHNVLNSLENEQLIGNNLNKLKRIINEISAKVISRKEVVFFPFNSEYWYVFEQEYLKCVNDSDIDVYVVPIPYYYKKYDGRLRDIQFNLDSYDRKLPLISYKDYDLKLRMPDKIYIQNPYDQYNEATSVHPDYYSLNLRKYTKELVYIPWFRTDDFSREVERAYQNMKTYCIMPGVLYSDRIILQSKVIKERYIEKLVDTLGLNYKRLFEEKIFVEDKTEANNAKKKSHMKKLAFMPDFSMFIEYGSDFIQKIKRSLDIISNSHESLELYFIQTENINNYLKKLRPELYKEYISIVEEYKVFPWCHIVDDQNVVEIVNECDAYYGDSGVLAHCFRNAGKPVMIENVAI